MANQTVVHSHSFPVLGLLGVAFVILKLCGIIAWPWLWVLAPFWLVLALCVLVPVIFLVVAGLFAAIAGVIGYIAKKFSDD